MYDEKIAKHYAAYRPPLHGIILERTLGAIGKNGLVGLDIGSGTGRSSNALSNYCDFVFGLEPSAAMIDKAERGKGVRYINATAEKIPLHENEVDIVTLAGSLHYVDGERLITELGRVCKPDAVIVVYDFNIDLSAIEARLELQRPQNSSSYDHSINLRGYSGLDEISVVEDQVELEVTAAQAAHLLLAENSRYDLLRNKYPGSDPFDALKDEIEKGFSVGPKVTAKLFYSLYRLQ